MYLMDVVDEYILILVCDIEKFFLMFVEDVFLIIGCGIVVFGCIDCGIVKVGDEVEIVGLYEDVFKLIVMGFEMFCKIFDLGEVGDNVGVLLCGVNCE